MNDVQVRVIGRPADVAEFIARLGRVPEIEIIRQSRQYASREEATSTCRVYLDVRGS